MPPAVDGWNFASRLQTPVLMMNGKDDFIFPFEASQLPLFRLLGTPEKDKKHRLYRGRPCNPVTRLEMVKEVLDSLNSYLGPVTMGAQ